MFGSATLFFLPLFMLLKPALSTPLTVKVFVEAETSHAATIPSNHHQVDKHAFNIHLGSPFRLLAVDRDRNPLPDGFHVGFPPGESTLALSPVPVIFQIDDDGGLSIGDERIEVRMDGTLFKYNGEHLSPDFSWTLLPNRLLAPKRDGDILSPEFFIEGFDIFSRVYTCNSPIPFTCRIEKTAILLKAIPADFDIATKNVGTQETLEL